jgi:hypothetical protein
VDQDAAFHVESGDRLALWLNGALLFTSEAPQPAHLRADQATGRLRQGWNSVLVKTTEGGGGWGFRLAIDGSVPLQERRSPVIDPAD